MVPIRDIVRKRKKPRLMRFNICNGILFVDFSMKMNEYWHWSKWRCIEQFWRMKWSIFDVDEPKHDGGCANNESVRHIDCQMLSLRLCAIELLVNHFLHSSPHIIDGFLCNVWLLLSIHYMYTVHSCDRWLAVVVVYCAFSSFIISPLLLFTWSIFIVISRRQCDVIDVSCPFIALYFLDAVLSIHPFCVHVQLSWATTYCYWFD